jgi:hypothetical protein
MIVTTFDGKLEDALAGCGAFTKDDSDPAQNAPSAIVNAMPSPTVLRLM